MRSQEDKYEFPLELPNTQSLQCFVKADSCRHRHCNQYFYTMRVANRRSGLPLTYIPKEQMLTWNIIGWTSRPNGRGTFDVLQSCLIIIILCSWPVLFLNVSSEHDGCWDSLQANARWMLFSIIFAKPLTGTAIEQRRSPYQSVEDFTRPEGHGQAGNHPPHCQRNDSSAPPCGKERKLSSQSAMSPSLLPSQRAEHQVVLSVAAFPATSGDQLFATIASASVRTTSDSVPSIVSMESYYGSMG